MKSVLIFPLIITIVLLVVSGCNSNTAPDTGSTWLGEADPNPLQVGETTTIPLRISDGDTGYVFIKNSLGQPVRTFSFGEGSHSIVWNGRDDEGRICASGVYYYTLLTASMNITRKMVIYR